MRQAGFTLIELMVTVTIVILLSGAAVATYLNFRERQVVNDDASNVAERLRTVQVKAAAAEVPSGCATGITSYTVTITTPKSLAVRANCTGGGNTAVPELAMTLANSVFQANNSITFYTRTITASYTSATINLCGNKNLYTVTVNSAANVAKPVYAGSC